MSPKEGKLDKEEAQKKAKERVKTIKKKIKENKD